MGGRESWKVTVVIPAYNAETFLAEAIRGALGQTLPPEEILVVDDGSTDGTAAVARDFGSPVRLLSQENRGVAAARNRGLGEVATPWCAFLDADDVWELEKLEAQMALATGGGEFTGVHCGARLVGPREEALGVRKGKGGDVLEDLVLFRDEVVVSGGSGLLASTALLRRMSGFREDLSTSADWDLYRRLAARGPLGYVPAPFVRYRIHGGNMHRDLDLFEGDMTYALRLAFQEAPLDRSSGALRRRAFGSLYRIFAGARFQEGSLFRFSWWAIRSLALWPRGVTYFLAYPKRRRKR